MFRACSGVFMQQTNPGFLFMLMCALGYMLLRHLIISSVSNLQLTCSKLVPSPSPSSLHSSLSVSPLPIFLRNMLLYFLNFLLCSKQVSCSNHLTYSLAHFHSYVILFSMVYQSAQSLDIVIMRKVIFLLSIYISYIFIL